ncbi:MULTISPECIES: DUF2064 domain-containing protein [unclassified Frondihabitans]|uniref:TIGR04282 family arsenosugar biosynthesis glycosyltransferase n=1 Tax=unclassified Frondihabitans TaxID=2626248 RepID=UPI000F4FC96A|nr:MULTISPECIES: DUF2064 domain-containing protein [unclassified Frondihabitans]RPE76192.1 hypothetical protein EDF37_2011 [Frondihabitans sp. PhB153]RPF05532.1 hypothetical protein EDF39_2237 [Frondihabitans sp. PhB161]
MTTLVVIAKECLPGKVKTRLHPPLTLEQAAEVAAASLGDTLLATDSLPASRRILLFDGNRPPVGSEQFDVIPQTTGPLDERIAALFELVTGPTVLIGMDTPQLVRDDLAPAFDGEWPDDIDAWYGASTDGGFWALGLRDPDGSLVRGVPMSRDDTGAHQLARLADAGLRVSRLRTLTDVDHIDDAIAAAAAAPDGRFAAVLNDALGSTE